MNVRVLKMLALLKQVLHKFIIRFSIWILLIIAAILIGSATFIYYNSYIKDHFTSFLIVEIAGLIIAIYAAYEASNAAQKSQKTQERLVDIGLLPTHTRSKFERIFNEHLVQPLQNHSYKGKPAEIYLLLSTPSYGYGVLGQNVSSLRKAIKDLNQGCKVQVIFFSPDAHFHYWCNVLLWSIAREGKEQFAINFALDILEFLKRIENKEWKIWLTGETTVRLFAFFNHEKSEVYLLLVDRFSITQDQFGDRFKSRSVKVLLPQVQEYVSGEYSYFDRIKQCPYTLKAGDEAALCLEKNGVLLQLNFPRNNGHTERLGYNTTLKP
ncbi:MAG: hypothetical protein A2Y97_10860 [Nitrospirae bacterium RBG_13_39_12]|nr:MAG: hypothetical protein A2Y97_10860 [Nitrospirae bacterium RBG_13_39_12]